MSEKVEFELVAPERLLLSRAVDMVVIPGAEGDLGVLAQHAPMISTVRPGIIAVFEDGEVTERIFVAGGFAEITQKRCTVLADEAMPVDEIDRAQTEQEIRDLREDVAVAEDEAERRKAERALAIAEARLAATETQIY